MSQALIIGAGPAGLMAADVLSAAGHDVTICDAMPSVGRKFLMAGKSGLNLTKDESIDKFVAQYGAIHPTFETALRTFGPVDVMAWAEDLEQAIFTGSTGRVFPKAMKASPLLRAWLVRLRAANVTFQTRWKWTGFDGKANCFDTPDGPQKITPDVTVCAFGGASWAKLGSNGEWAAHLDGTTPFQPSNMGFAVQWTDHMLQFMGQPVKATALHAGRKISRGEWVLTPQGIEGGGIYEISATVRDGAQLCIDLMPDLSGQDVLARAKKRRSKQTFSQFLKKSIRLSPIKAALFQEFTRDLNLETPDAIATTLKALPLSHQGPLPQDGAISTVGGLRISELTQTFMIKDRPGMFAAGEMLDWDAPTGGYLINGCLAGGRAAGHGAVMWLAQSNQ